MAIHTLMLSQTLTHNEYYELATDAKFSWKPFRNKQHQIVYLYSSAFSQQGISLLQLYSYTKHYYNQSKTQIIHSDTYNFITITVNPNVLLGGTGYLATKTNDLEYHFFRSLISTLYYISPILGYEYTTLRRIDLALDIPTSFAKEYLQLIKYGYPLPRHEALSPLSCTVSSDIIDSILLELEQKYPGKYNTQRSLYYSNNSININIYHKYSQIIRIGQIPAETEDFLRIELQIKKPKLYSLMKKYNIPNRTLHDFIHPHTIEQLQYDLLQYYLMTLCGTGTYVSKNHAIEIINYSTFTNYRKTKMLELMDEITKHHGISAFLNYASNVPQKSFGSISNIKHYLKDINSLGINPVILSRRCNSMTCQSQNSNSTSKYLPNLTTYLYLL